MLFKNLPKNGTVRDAVPGHTSSTNWYKYTTFTFSFKDYFNTIAATAY